MPSITITLDGVDLKEVPLTETRTSLGRRPYNHIVMDHLAVSGEHAVFVLHPDGVELIDLHSTNGTYVNGKAIHSTRLQPQDLIEIGRYRLRLKDTTASPRGTPATAVEPTPTAAAGHDTPDTELGVPLGAARICVVGGPANGKEMTLTKVVTTLGKPGVGVAAITHRGDGYALSWVDGHQVPHVNGQPIGKDPRPLQHEDEIVLAGTRMKFLLN